MLKRGGTKLSNILQNQIWLECACGRNGPVQVKRLVEKYGAQITVANAIDQLRCSRCGTKQVKNYRISYLGGSMTAMLGAEQGPRN